jgi:hypothetical protein
MGWVRSFANPGLGVRRQFDQRKHPGQKNDRNNADNNDHENPLFTASLVGGGKAALGLAAKENCLG